jgi:glutamate racemase
MRAPIGVFDSGVGGLTVLRALRAQMPQEDFIYLGDTARLPYGTKSADTVVRYSTQCAAALVARGIRALVVACNTASASALPELRRRFSRLPVFGVIEPGAAAAVAATTSGVIAVIATEGTIAHGAYQAAIRERLPSAEVRARACPLFVALAEEAIVDGPIVAAVARRYLDSIFAASNSPDTLVLGCTHFPVLAPAIAAVLPAGVRIVDSAETTARAVAAGVAAAAEAGSGRITWLATDGAPRFARVGAIFFGRKIEPSEVQIIDL